MTTTVRSPESPLARPGEFIRAIWFDLRRSRQLAVEMARRDVRSQHRQTLAGAAGTALPVVALTAVALGFRSAGILQVHTVAVPYALFVLTGVVFWMTFVDALYAPIHGLAAEERLLAATSAPVEAIVLGKLGPVLFNAGIRSALIAAALVWYQMPLPLTAVLAPLGLLALAALGTVCGVLLAPVNLLFRDVSRLLVPVTTFWLFLSPVYFPVPAGGAVATIMRLNPVTRLLDATRDVLLTGNVTAAGTAAAIAAAAVLVLALAMAWICARVAIRVALERI